MAVQSGIYRGVSAEDRAAKRRTRLLEATLEIWADPERRTTMTAVCAEARLTERYFYESFTGLLEAQRTVLEGVADEIEQTVTSAADEAEDDPAAQAIAMMYAFVHFIANDPRKGRVAIIEAGAMPELRQRRTELLRYLAHRVTEEARARLGPPKHTEDEDEITGILFIGGMAELVTAWLDGTLEATPDQIVESTTHAFISLYG